ncbi:MAG: glycosyl hydrolase family 28 protein [Rikenellaceae bacterium]
MNFKNLLLTAVMLLSLAATAQSRKVYNVSDYGVVADGTTLNTTSIQSLIDKASKKGGGQVVFDSGDYLTGMLMLKSNVEIYLKKGATILGSTNPRHYQNLESKQAAGDGEEQRNDNSKMALIAAHDCKNIAIKGEGTIDGQGLKLALTVDSLHHAGEMIDPRYNMFRMRPNETMRPKLFFISECENIEIEGVHLRNSACWGLTFDLCRNLTINRIDMLNRAYWNNDGIDVTDSYNVRITNSNINAADDGICLKSYHTDAFNDQIYIADCTIRSSASAIKFGTASWGGFKNVTIERIKVIDTYRSAIAIESVDGGDIENIVVRDIEAYNTGNALFIRRGHRAGEAPGVVKNIHISRMYVEVPFDRPDSNYDLRGPSVTYVHNIHPAPITGITGYNIEDVTLEDIEIVYPGRATKGMAYVPLNRLDSIDEKAKNYPEFSVFGELPSWGFYIKNVDNITMKNVTLRLKDEDFRPAFVLHNVGEVTLSDVSMPKGEDKSQIILKNVGGYSIENQDEIEIIE